MSKRSKLLKFRDKIQHKYWDTVPYDLRPGQLWYRFKCRFWKKHTTIKPRYLPHTYCDRVEVLPHIMFEVLSQFIEKECSPGIVDWEGSGHMIEVDGVTRNVREEMQIIYDWWHNDYMKKDDKIHAAWKASYEFAPKTSFIPVDMQGNVIPEEDAELFEWHEEYASEEQKTKHRELVKARADLELEYEDKRREMMHRLVNLQPYLWT